MEAKPLQITVPRPDSTINSTRVDCLDEKNICNGRGSKSAAARGYNMEYLTEQVFKSRGPLNSERNVPWFDKYKKTDEQCLLIETKSVVNRYSNGSLGKFRIWKRNHSKLLTERHPRYPPDIHPDMSFRRIYFFIVYQLRQDHPIYKDDFGEELIPFELGKIAVDAETVDEIIRSRFYEVDHSSMGNTEVADLSWKMLLRELKIFPDDFKSKDMMILPDYLTR